MALSFPTNPSLNDEYSYGGMKWIFDGSQWVSVGWPSTPPTRSVGNSLATSGTIDLDMALLHGSIQTITLAGNPTFTTSNRSAGKEITLVLSAGGSARTLTWPSWTSVGTTLPTSLSSGKVLVVDVTFLDSTDSGAIASPHTQP